MVAISDNANTIDEACDNKMDAVTADNRKPGVAIAFFEIAKTLLQWKRQG